MSPTRFLLELQGREQSQRAERQGMQPQVRLCCEHKSKQQTPSPSLTSIPPLAVASSTPIEGVLERPSSGKIKAGESSCSARAKRRPANVDGVFDSNSSPHQKWT